MEGNGQGLITITSWHFLGGTEENNKKSQSGQLESRTLLLCQAVQHKITYTPPEVEEQIPEPNWSDQSPDLLSDLDASVKRLPPSLFRLSVNRNICTKSVLNVTLSAYIKSTPIYQK
jgi:hypothetical protein